MATVRYPSLFVLPFSPLGAYPFLRAFLSKKAKALFKRAEAC